MVVGYGHGCILYSIFFTKILTFPSSGQRFSKILICPQQWTKKLSQLVDSISQKTFLSQLGDSGFNQPHQLYISKNSFSFYSKTSSFHNPNSLTNNGRIYSQYMCNVEGSTIDVFSKNCILILIEFVRKSCLGEGWDL